MVFSNTWVYSKKDTRDIHTGWWSLVNCWREGSDETLYNVLMNINQLAVGLTAGRSDGLALMANRCINVIPRQNTAKQIAVLRCQRIGRYSRNRPCPVSTELIHKQDIEFILNNKFDFPRGIYVDKEYPVEIERKRKTLLPVLRAAKKLTYYKRQSQLDEDKLVLKGRSYNVNTLNQLPDELNVFKVTSKEDESTVGFFGEINPLSNFYPTSFDYEGVKYISSEQLIQANKAKLFGDMDIYNQILCSSTSIECKNLLRLIRNVDESKWQEEAARSVSLAYVPNSSKTQTSWTPC